MSEYCLELNDIIKEFSGVRVLHNVSLHVKRGEVHAICGENGAGKSTLMKILSGVYPYGEYSGQIILDGQERTFNNIKSAEEMGVEIINQELELIPYMTVGENIFLGNEPKNGPFIDKNRIAKESEELLNRLNLIIDSDTKVGELGVGRQQLVAIAKALTREVKVLILDEPTAALTESETEKLFTIIRDLQKQNVTCIYISHKLNEIKEIADTITILRDGRTVITEDCDKLDERAIISHMVGREIDEQFPKADNEIGEVALSVKNWNAIDINTGAKILDDVNFSVRKGEILGVAGLMGAGRTELVMSLFGALRAKVSGEMQLEGKEVRIKTPNDAIRRGIGLVVEDRKTSGLVSCMSVPRNITLANLEKILKRRLLSAESEINAAKKYVGEMSIKTPKMDIDVDRLSGGNQQKVVIARTLFGTPKVLILDEPTRGIDVGAKYDIYLQINKIASQGIAVIMVSSELPEILGLSDKVLVMREGKVAGELENKNITQSDIMHLATMGEGIQQ